jgi:hypothetical protein
MPTLRPLGLPAGSVRALLLLGLAARAILDLRDGFRIEAWLAAALIVAAAAYFSARASSMSAEAGPAGQRVRPPLGLPRGTIRTLFLLALTYGVWLWQRGKDDLRIEDMPVAWVLIGFVLGVLVRWFFAKMQRPDDLGTPLFFHLQALVALVAVGGLIAISATRPGEGVPDWAEPLLAATVVYYFGAR